MRKFEHISRKFVKLKNRRLIYDYVLSNETKLKYVHIKIKRLENFKERKIIITDKLYSLDSFISMCYFGMQFISENNMKYEGNNNAIIENFKI